MFYLAYGGLGWGYSEIESLPIALRRRFVERLEMQLECEREEIEKAKR